MVYKPTYIWGAPSYRLLGKSTTNDHFPLPLPNAHDLQLVLLAAAAAHMMRLLEGRQAVVATHLATRCGGGNA